MGVPAFYRWLSEKYPKIVQDVLEERVKLVSNDGTMRLPFDGTKPNPSGLEADNLYIDMNGIIHPCSHPENGPQPATEEEMFENVCRYIDRLVRAVRPRQLLYLAIDGVAPRAKMNQQRARRFRSAQEARELAELEEHVRQELIQHGQNVPPVKKAWDSNVITPGTTFMLNLSEYVRFYIRKRISTDKAWKNLRVIFTDASLPGEGEHKIMSHIRLQRSQPGYNPNLVHVLHGLDADLIMLALATHEMHFYILREVVTFGRRSEETLEKRQQETGFKDAQRQLDEAAGPVAMELPENKHKPLQRVSIPILREYLQFEFASCLDPQRVPFPISFERLLDDIVFLCFFVGNDFLPHLPSLDIRDGALDFLFNVYKRILPTLGDYITNHGGRVNLSCVDIILAEVGAIEDHVFAMKHENETRNEQRRKEMDQRRKGGKRAEGPPPTVMVSSAQPPGKAMGKSARILERQKQNEAAARGGSTAIALSRGHVTKEDARKTMKAKKMVADANLKAAMELKQSLMGKSEPTDESMSSVKQEDGKGKFAGKTEGFEGNGDGQGVKRKFDEDTGEEEQVEETSMDEVEAAHDKGEVEVEETFVDDDKSDNEDEDDEGDDVDETKDLGIEIEEPELPEEVDPVIAEQFKNKVKERQQKKLDDYKENVQDNVRLHEKGWKERYYTDKCKAEDVSTYGGKEHMFRSYVMGLCWVMKYYFDGCPSWKWYYPFHYAPFASDLRNIERFRKDCDAFDLNEPFRPVEQLMAVLPEDSAHAIPKASRWLMSDPESPIIDFYPKDVPVDPNGKAMPWLWVVLLPFIEEDRLFAAMRPTMEKWTKQEEFCNARGMDDGYLYINTSQSLMKKLSDVVGTDKGKKMRLVPSDMAFYGCRSFSGSVRMPLSNEVHPIEENVTIQPPSSSSNITRESFDHLFSEPIEVNTAFCVAFSEPLKLPHKSVMLPGAKGLAPTLSEHDKRIRHPRLNRGGASIANMGGSNQRSHQSGQGSMNISSYERDLAAKTGRGGQMYQAGTRTWGSMEPTPKRIRQHGPPQQPPYPSNPFQQQGAAYVQGSQQQQYARPPWQQQPQYSQGPPQYQYAQQQQQRFPPPPPHPQPQGYGQQMRPTHFNQQQPYHQGPPPPPPPQQNRPYSFQGYNRGGPPQGQQRRQQPPQARQSNQPPSRVNANVMSSLRSQLASTLQRNRNGSQRNDQK